MSNSQQRWDTIYGNRELNINAPAQVLSDNDYLLPNKGIALDLACGLGGNTFFLANKGLNVDAWDISTVAINFIQQQPASTQINASTQDLETVSFPTNHYDVIVVSRYLDRSIAPSIINALRPNGLIFYQTFIRDKVADVGPSSDKYLLAPNELLTLFAPLSLITYREDAQTGDIQQGVRNEAMLVAQKR